MTLEAWVNPAAVSGGEVIQQRSSRTDCFSLWSSWSGPLGELYPQCPVWASGVAVVQSLTPLSYNVEPRHRGGDRADRARAGNRDRALQPARPRLPDRRDHDD